MALGRSLSSSTQSELPYCESQNGTSQSQLFGEILQGKKQLPSACTCFTARPIADRLDVGDVFRFISMVKDEVVQ